MELEKLDTEVGKTVVAVVPDITLINKINELIEAVNKLLGERDE